MYVSVIDRACEGWLQCLTNWRVVPELNILLAWKRFWCALVALMFLLNLFIRAETWSQAHSHFSRWPRLLLEALINIYIVWGSCVDLLLTSCYLRICGADDNIQTGRRGQWARAESKGDAGDTGAGRAEIWVCAGHGWRYIHAIYQEIRCLCSCTVYVAMAYVRSASRLIQIEYSRYLHFGSIYSNRIEFRYCLAF